MLASSGRNPHRALASQTSSMLSPVASLTKTRAALRRTAPHCMPNYLLIEVNTHTERRRNDLCIEVAVHNSLPCLPTDQKAKPTRRCVLVFIHLIEFDTD